MTRKHAILLAVVLMATALVGCRSAHVTSAILYIDEQMYQRAVDVLHEGLEYSPNEAEAYFYLGESHTHLAEEAVGANDYPKARSQYTTAYENYVKSLELDAGMAERVEESLLYSYQLRSGDGGREYDQARSADGDRKQGYYEAAEGHFRLAYAAYPDSTASIKNIARMKIQLASETPDLEGQRALYDQSLALLDQVLEANPDAYGLLSDKANVLSKLGRGDEANLIYDDLIVHHPDDTGLLIDIANLASEQENYKRAADLYVKVAGIYEEDEDVLNDADMLNLHLQAARFYALPSVLDYPAAIANYDAAMDLEDIVQEDTLFNKLKVHHDYGKVLAGEPPSDPLPPEAASQFEMGVNTGNALVGSYFDNQYGYYYLALCQFALGNETEGNEAMEQYRSLSGMSE